MSLQILRSFIEVYRCRSISAAARNLSMTQPAVSQHISALEEQIGRQLFRRQPRGVAPTAVANDLAAQIGDGLDRAESALSLMKARSSQLSGTVHIAGPPELMAEWVAPHLVALQEAGLQLRIRLGGKAALYSLLLDAQADLALTASKPADSRLDGQCVGSERLLAVAKPELAGSISNAVSFETALFATPFVAYDSELPLIRTWCDQNRVRLKDKLPSTIAPDIRMLRALVEAGAGWSIIPDYLCADLLNAKTLAEIAPPVATPTNDFYLVWLKSALRHPRVALTRQLLLNAFA